MTIEKFIKESFKSEIKFTNLGYIPNKTLSKIFKQFKYIDVREYWFDNPDNPDEFVWEDIEGMGYGWMWLNYRKSNRKLRNALRKFGLGLHSKEDVWTYQYDNVKSYLFGLNDEIIEIRVSNEELEPW